MLFAFFFDEDHPENAMPFGPQFASKIIVPIERMDPVPETRLLTGGLLHNMLVYEVEGITLGGSKIVDDKPRLGVPERAQHSVPNHDRRLSIICDLAETLSESQSSFTEEEILKHLARKNIWVIVTLNLSAAQALAVHESIAGFGPYLGYASVDPGNPLHRKLFMGSLFNDKAIGPQGLAFRRDILDDDDDHTVFTGEYGSKRPPASYNAEEFDARFPAFPIPTANSSRGDITVGRLSGNDPGHRARVARELINIESEKIISPFSFSARKPDDDIEFVLPSSKFTDYLLNPSHEDGGPKAKFFIDSLEIRPEDWRYLADQILQGVKSGEFYRLKLSPYGVSHGALVLVTGRNGRTAVIETGWRVPEKGPALFVTAYPADEKLSKGLSPNLGRVPPPNVVGKERWAEIHKLANMPGCLRRNTRSQRRWFWRDLVQFGKGNADLVGFNCLTAERVLPDGSSRKGTGTRVGRVRESTLTR